MYVYFFRHTFLHTYIHIALLPTHCTVKYPRKPDFMRALHTHTLIHIYSERDSFICATHSYLFKKGLIHMRGLFTHTHVCVLTHTHIFSAWLSTKEKI